LRRDTGHLLRQPAANRTGLPAADRPESRTGRPGLDAGEPGPAGGGAGGPLRRAAGCRLAAGLARPAALGTACPGARLQPDLGEHPLRATLRPAAALPEPGAAGLPARPGRAAGFLARHDAGGEVGRVAALGAATAGAALP